MFVQRKFNVTQGLCQIQISTSFVTAALDTNIQHIPIGNRRLHLGNILPTQLGNINIFIIYEVISSRPLMGSTFRVDYRQIRFGGETIGFMLQRYFFMVSYPKSKKLNLFALVCYRIVPRELENKTVSRNLQLLCEFLLLPRQLIIRIK